MESEIVDIIDELKSDKYQFILSPNLWERLLNDLPELNWNEIKFSEKNKDNIPTERGVYTFIVKSNNSSLPNHGYIVYIGITGDGKSMRSLRDRYLEYLREIHRPKRYHVHYMMNKWNDHLYFHYCVIKDKTVRLAEIETKLLTGLVPPVNQKDFKGDFGKNVQAAWK